MNIFAKIFGWLAKKPYLGELAVFVIFIGLYLPLQAGNVFADPDSFYHLKMAELMLSHGPIRQFIWLPFTTLSSAFADHHFLYHAALIPFIKILGPLTGIKTSTAVFAALAITVLGWAMRKSGVKYAFMWAVLAGIMSPLIFRIGLSKASGLGVALLMVGLALALQKRRWPLFVVSFVYVWTHGGWPALLALGTIAIAIVSWDGKLGSTFRALRFSVLALWSGALAGLLVNPFFPQNLKFYWEQVVQIAVINYQSAIGVGQEWYPYPFASLVKDLPILAILLGIAIIVGPALWAEFRAKDRAHSRVVLAVTVCALIFLLLTLRSRRHVEYFVPLGVWAAAMWWSLVPRGIFWPRFKRYWPSLALLVLGSLCFLVGSARDSFSAGKRDLGNGYRFDLYKNAAAYLSKNTQPNDVVVHADWDDFPPLFYWNSQNHYIMGLDPTFMYRADHGRYQRYVDFTLGKSADPVGVMKELGSRYVVADHEHTTLENSLVSSGSFKKVYTDNDAVIYVLK